MDRLIFDLQGDGFSTLLVDLHLTRKQLNKLWQLAALTRERITEVVWVRWPGVVDGSMGQLQNVQLNSAIPRYFAYFCFIPFQKDFS